MVNNNSKNYLKKIQLKNKKTIIIRFITHPDIIAIWENYNKVIEEQIYLPSFSLVEKIWEKELWYTNLREKNNVCFVAENPELNSPYNIVGQLTLEHLEWEATRHVYQLGIIIQKEYRNIGLGYNLITSALEIAKQQGKRKIILSTFATNLLGITLYEKCGFSKVGTYKNQFLIQGQYIDEILMECELKE